MKQFRLFLALLTLVLLVAVQPLQAAEPLHLSGPASMTNALKDLIALYEKKEGATQVLPNIGSSGAMAKQIKQGAPADIYISANVKWMKFLHDGKLIDPATEKVLVTNKLVFVGQENHAVNKLADILQLKRIAIGSPKSVPAGEYAAQAMKKAGLYSKLTAGKQLIMAKDVRQALAYADRGEAEGAFVYKTDAMLATQAKILFEVEQALYKPITYPMALTTTGTGKAEAKAFYAFLHSAEAMSVFSKYGFVPAQ